MNIFIVVAERLLGSRDMDTPISTIGLVTTNEGKAYRVGQELADEMSLIPSDDNTWYDDCEGANLVYIEKKELK